MLKGRQAESYNDDFLAIADQIGLPSFGMLLILRHLLPANGGAIRVNALARAIGMSPNNIRKQIEHLREFGYIFPSHGDQEGRWISFTDDKVQSIGNSFFAGEQMESGNIKLASDKNVAENIISHTPTHAGGKIIMNSVSRFTYPQWLKQFYFACKKIRSIKILKIFRLQLFAGGCPLQSKSRLSLLLLLFWSFYRLLKPTRPHIFIQ